MKLKLFILLLCLAPFTSIVGQEFEVNGIRYTLVQERATEDTVAYITKYSCAEPDDVIIPDSVHYSGKSFAVVGIEEFAFLGCSNLISINLPKSLKEIGASAFYRCISLTSINIPNSVIYVGDYAFSDSRIRELKIDKATPNIGSAAFSSKNLNSISVSKNNRRYMVKDGVLFSKNRDTLFCYPAQKTDTLYNIPNGVKVIMPGAFSGCAHLKSVAISVSMSKIGDYAFFACFSLEKLTKLSNIKSIGESAFGYCDSLKYIDLPNTVESIGAGAFERCKSLTSLNLPNSITKIEFGTFKESGIVSIEIPSSVVEIEKEAFSDCSQLKEITLPNTLKEIGRNAFERCKSLENIVLPDSLQYITNDLFSKSGIKKITIPKRVKSLSPNCLSDWYCWTYLPENIEEVTVLWDNPSDVSIGESDNSELHIYDKKTILRVPKGTKELYEADLRWSGFREIVEYDVEKE